MTFHPPLPLHTARETEVRSEPHQAVRNPCVSTNLPSPREPQPA
jgi:hypothetical protein